MLRDFSSCYSVVKLYNLVILLYICSVSWFSGLKLQLKIIENCWTRSVSHQHCTSLRHIWLLTRTLCPAHWNKLEKLRQISMYWDSWLIRYMEQSVFILPLSLSFTLCTKFLFISMLDLRLSTEQVGMAVTLWVCMQESCISLSLSCVRGSASYSVFSSLHWWSLGWYLQVHHDPFSVAVRDRFPYCSSLKSALMKPGVMSLNTPWSIFCCNAWLFPHLVQHWHVHNLRLNVSRFNCKF